MLANLCLESDPLAVGYLSLHLSARLVHATRCVLTVCSAEMQLPHSHPSADSWPSSSPPVLWDRRPVLVMAILSPGKWPAYFFTASAEAPPVSTQAIPPCLGAAHPTAFQILTHLSRKSQLLPLKGFPAHLVVNWLTS